MSELLDPDELPFTRDEIARAFRLFYPEDVAESVADHFAECAPGLIEIRAERRAQWQAAGIPNAATMPLYGWHYDEELLPALASLSPDVAARVEQLVQDRWDSTRRSHLDRLREAAAVAARLIPSREELLQRLEAEFPHANALAMHRQPIPPATAEMEEQARAVAAAEEAEFRRAVESFRHR
jgi:hypothetical protein